VVENRPGAVGSIGAAAVASAQPTGHTLLCTPDAPIVLSPLINRGLPYDPDAFEPVISLAVTYSIVAVRRDLPAASIAELIAYASPWRCRPWAARRRISGSPLPETAAGGGGR
jgi:tripartite-type tricarboxylate transporter receptor subunit TctC